MARVGPAELGDRAHNPLVFQDLLGVFGATVPPDSAAFASMGLAAVSEGFGFSAALVQAIKFLKYMSEILCLRAVDNVGGSKLELHARSSRQTAQIAKA